MTREEMASFLARTAGLGGNPPVANALTAVSAQTAASATNATNATNAANATHATSADTAANAQQLGGLPPAAYQPAGAYLPAAGNTTLRYPGMLAHLATGTSVASVTPTLVGGALIGVSARGSATAVVPLPRATAEHGRPLAVAALRVCFETAGAGLAITGTRLAVSERGDTTETVLYADTVSRGETPTSSCYDAAVAPRAMAGMNYLLLDLNSTSTGQRDLTLYSVTLTLTPLAAGAAEDTIAGEPSRP